MKKSYADHLIKLADFFEKKTKLAQENDLFKDIEKDIEKHNQNQLTQSVDEKIDMFRFDHFDGTDGTLLEMAASLLSPTDRTRLMSYVNQKYPAKGDEDRTVQLLSDPQVMAIVKPIMDKIRKKWETWKASHVDGEKEYQQFEAKKQEEQAVAAEKARTRRPFTEADLTILNFRTTNQLEMDRRVRVLNGGKAKGKIIINMILEPDLSIDYQVNFAGTGMDEALRQKIVDGLHVFDNNIKTEINNKLLSQNKYIASNLMTTLWQGNL